MDRIKLLDCTLRDGGFVNNWRFGEDSITTIYERLIHAGIDIIEIGYLRDYIEFDPNSTQYPDTTCIANVIPKHSSASSIVVAIIDFGDCDISHIQPRQNSVLDGIRVTFKKKDRSRAMEFCKQIQSLGYLVSLQPVSIMDYSAQDVIDLIDDANKLNPFAVCIVDTYGFMHKRDLLRYFYLMDSVLLPQIYLGYHSHNNFQLAYSNATELIEQITNRKLIIDSSVSGMGKGAGNANTELLALYLNENFGAHYDLDELLEIADTYIEKEKEKSYWGYSLKYYLAAANDCHYRYISFLLEKKSLSIKSINEIIAKIDTVKKTHFDESYISTLYYEYQKNNINDISACSALVCEIGIRPVLIIAPGNSLNLQAKKITEFIDNQNPWIVAINHVSEIIHTDAIFVSNIKRYGQISLHLRKRSRSTEKIIATSNIAPVSLPIDFCLNYETLLVPNPYISDNSTLMFLNACAKLGISSVNIAGFDGYQRSDKNYVDDQLDFLSNVEQQNEKIRDALTEIRSRLKINFITHSIYNTEDV